MLTHTLDLNPPLNLPIPPNLPLTLPPSHLNSSRSVLQNNMNPVRNGQRRVDPLAAIFNGQNQTGKVSRQKQEYQRQGRDVNNTRQKSGSQAQVQRSKVRQSGVKHRDSRMNRRTLRNVTRGKQDFALGECLCAAFMWVREWGAGVVRQSELMSEWWQLCDWCNGGRECVSAVHDGKCSPWVMCSLSEWEPDSWQTQ